MRTPGLEATITGRANDSCLAEPAISPAQAQNNLRSSYGMPRGIPFIVVNEFGERFCFYGINSTLALFLVQSLRFGEAEATTWASLFKAGAYVFPLLGAIISDVWWGKFRTVVIFSLIYVIGCVTLALSPDARTLAVGLSLVAFGTGGIRPCIASNLGDQFTENNQHLIERAFSWFYLAINAGSAIAIVLCPWLLSRWGTRLAFGVPACMMLLATGVFWFGRRKYAVVPPAGKAWLHEVLGTNGRKTIAKLSVIYVSIAFFWALWDQSNGTTWALQARSSLMDKHLGFGVTVLPAQVQAVNTLFILVLAPAFSYILYPAFSKVLAVTPMRKIGVGLLVTASSFLVIAWIESRIQANQVVSIWWQILAYAILTMGEVLVAVTALELSYSQSPLTMKSFIMALYALAVAMGNLLTAGVNHYMIQPLRDPDVTGGGSTWLHLADVSCLVAGQKIDFQGRTGIWVAPAGGAVSPLSGTYLVGAVDRPHERVSLLNAQDRSPIVSHGAFDRRHARVSTYSLVGPAYFLFFAKLLAGASVIFIVVARFFREVTYVRKIPKP